MRDDISDVPSAISGKPEPADETAAQREARYRRAIKEVIQLTDSPAPPPQPTVTDIAPAKFSLREMLILTTALAIVLGVVRAFSIWGGLATFIASIAWGNAIYPVWQPDERRQATMFDSIWGLLMPLVCLACDPLVFRDTEFGLGIGDLNLHDFKFGVRREAIAAYCFIVWQMSFLAAWLLGRGQLARFAGFFLGNFAAAVVFTALMGIALLVPAFLGTLFFGVGLMGFTPLFTCRVFARRLREAIQVGAKSHYFWLLAVVGFVLAIVVPLQIAAMLQPIIGAKPAEFF